MRKPSLEIKCVLIILTIVILSLLLLCGCHNGCLAKPELLGEGEVKQVEFITRGGFSGGINTAITFTDGQNIIVEGTANIPLYKKIRIYKTCIAGGSFIIEEIKE